MVLHLPETLWSSFRHYLIKRSSRPVGPVNESVFEEILSQYDDVETVFVHIGLSDIKSAFETNPYEFIMEHLKRQFSSILVPGFTKSFRDEGAFHVSESSPELGAYSTLFFENEMEYRTPDPLHSIMVSGEYRFEGVNFRNTFAPDGCYGQLEEENVLCLNIGTQWLVSTQLHYLEQVLDLPYVDTVEISGTITYEDGSTERIRQRNYLKNNYVYFWNRTKIRNEMMSAGKLDHFLLNGLSITTFEMEELGTFIRERVADDPYYLVR